MFKSLMRKETNDTYEAAYYMLQGAHLESVRIRRLQTNKAERMGVRNVWLMTMEGVPTEAVETWRVGQATANVKDIASARYRLKRKVHKALR